MTVLVSLYQVKESDRHHLKECNECGYIPVWEILRYAETTSLAKKKVYACSNHVDTLMFDVEYGRAGYAEDKAKPALPPSIEESSL